MMLHHRALSLDCFPKSSHLHFLNNNKNSQHYNRWTAKNESKTLTR